jgi:hypothetical protein
MEEVYPRIPRANTPEVFLRQPNPTSRIIYFPGDLDRTFWEILTTDHATLLRNAITWALDEAPVATATGPGILDLTVWQQANSMTVHLVNLTNPMMLKPSYRELLPLGPQTITLRLPPGKTPRALKLLVSNQTPLSTRTLPDTLTLQVDSILDFETIAIDF